MRLEHDCAVIMARELVEIVSNLIRPEERKDAFDEFYSVCKAGIEAFAIESKRQAQRLKPG